jgi:hypothetical protein
MNKNFDASAITQKRMTKAVALFQHTYTANNNAGIRMFLSGTTANFNASVETEVKEGNQYCCGPAVLNQPPTGGTCNQ